MSKLDSFRILLVEDDLSTRKLIKRLCMDQGVNNIVEASNGRDAVRILRNPPQVTAGDSILARKFSLIISDWYMPEMNGLELLRYVRNESRYKAVPFIFLTSQTEREYFEEAIQQGVTDYIIKPFTSDEFQEKMRKVIPRE